MRQNLPPDFPTITIRPATAEDLPLLSEKLAQQTYFEVVDLPKMIAYVAEYDGRVVGFTAARLVWQIEPLMLFEEFRRHAPKSARRRAALGLIDAIEGWLADRKRNTTGIYWYFCFIKGRVMQRLAEHYGLGRCYSGGRMYAKDI